jgi:hypothetical protein
VTRFARISRTITPSRPADKIVQAVFRMNGNPDAAESESGSARAVVLVTGMSGSGKSTVLAELKRCGHRVIDTDDPGWIVETNTSDGPEPMWDLDQIEAVIDDHRTGWLFIGGCVANQGTVYDRFDAVVLLSAPVDVILDRVANRPIHSDPRRRTAPRSPTIWRRSSRCCAQARIARS